MWLIYVQQMIFIFSKWLLHVQRMVFIFSKWLLYVQQMIFTFTKRLLYVQRMIIIFSKQCLKKVRSTVIDRHNIVWNCRKVSFNGHNDCHYLDVTTPSLILIHLQILLEQSSTYFLYLVRFTRTSHFCDIPEHNEGLFFGRLFYLL